MKKTTIYYAGLFTVIFCLYIIHAVSNPKMHDFEGKCPMCHINTPDNNTRNLMFTDKIDKLCAKCHALDRQKSHPIEIAPDRNIPLAAHLDKNGLLTCTTCHDVHKEDRISDRSELSGLLWGHLQGRVFCALCHSQETSKAPWRHQTALPYAHSHGKLMENPNGAQLDKYSIECLSCHDGTISRYPQVEVKQGDWQHEAGEKHPIGIEYPRSKDFTPPESLPKEIKLFNGTVGCLSCHEIYSKESAMLAMNNKGSRLCLSCHRK